MLLALLFWLLALAGTIFWIMMIVECVTKEPTQGNDKLVWVLIIVFTHLIGALLYYFIRRPERMAKFGA